MYGEIPAVFCVMRGAGNGVHGVVIWHDVMMVVDTLLCVQAGLIGCWHYLSVVSGAACVCGRCVMSA